MQGENQQNSGPKPPCGRLELSETRRTDFSEGEETPAKISRGKEMPGESSRVLL
jgi:hypothetical protein